MGECILSWVSIVISVLAMAGSIFVYLRHDKRLKEQQDQLNEQQKIINDYQLQKITKEEENGRKAEMRMNITRSPKGNREIFFFNAGKSDARNVKVRLLSDNINDFVAHKMNDKGEWGPYDVINPQDNRTDNLILYSLSSDEIKVEITWDDDYEQNRSIILTGQF